MITPGFSLGIFPLLAVLGVFKLRRSGQSVLKIPGYPFTSFIYLAVGLAILILAFLERPVESSIAIGTVLLGVLFYFLFKARNKP
ncbi:hypothetical protein HQ585_13770 [candidate division KSB1 bacterium]|nr:hypothetical protein [candidate division KSB1 bacterium]